MTSKLPVSPLAPKKTPRLPQLAGVRLATAATGSRYQGRDDLMLMQFAPTTTMAGVFTRSLMPSAAVDLSRLHMANSRGRAAALVVNAGNANAFTGAAGAKAAMDMAQGAAAALSCKPAQVYVASTGVIGEDLPTEPLLDGINAIARRFAAKPRAGFTGHNDHKAWLAAARAMMTTDTFPKLASQTARLGGKTVTLNGIAKGSGMIAPDMATMLAFVVTDAAIPARVLQSLLAQANETSFNAITVDGDTSTSDTCLLFATGVHALCGAPLRSANDKRLAGFKKALHELMQDLAVQTVSDGEGAGKLMVIDIAGAEDDAAARRIGLCVGNSPLVKTAVAGEDANWGRIVMAVGRSGELAERDRLAIDIGGVPVARRGRAVKGYDEKPIARHMRGRRIEIKISVGARGGKGKGRARIWASDLTHGYISINADYRS